MDRLKKTNSDEMTKLLIAQILTRDRPKKQIGTTLLALGMHLTAKYLSYQSMRSLHQIYKS